MYEVTVRMTVVSFRNIEEETKEAVLDFIKKHMGNYSEHDNAKLVEVLEVKEVKG